MTSLSRNQIVLQFDVEDLAVINEEGRASELSISLSFHHFDTGFPTETHIQYNIEQIRPQEDKTSRGLTPEEITGAVALLVITVVSILINGQLLYVWSMFHGL